MAEIYCHPSFAKITWNHPIYLALNYTISCFNEIFSSDRKFFIFLQCECATTKTFWVASVALHVLIIINSVSREFLCQNSHFTPSHFCKIYDLSRKKRMPSEDFSDEVSEVENHNTYFVIIWELFLLLDFTCNQYLASSTVKEALIWILIYAMRCNAENCKLRNPKIVP